MTCKYDCRRTGLMCPRPVSCAAKAAVHVQNGGEFVDTDYGHSRFMHTRITDEVPEALEPTRGWLAKCGRWASFATQTVAIFAMGGLVGGLIYQLIKHWR